MNKTASLGAVLLRLIIHEALGLIPTETHYRFKISNNRSFSAPISPQFTVIYSSTRKLCPDQSPAGGVGSGPAL